MVHAIKNLLIQIGTNIFGISKSKLSNSSKPKAIQIVRDALENAKAYDIIEKQSRIAGEQRRN